MVEERELVARVLAGDPEAEDAFYNMFRPRLLRASAYFLGMHDPEAEDIVQETFVVALPKLLNYDFRAPIYAWLRQICMRLCYARVRKRSREWMSIEEDLEVLMRRMAMERVDAEDLETMEKRRLGLLTEMKKVLGPASSRIIELRHVQGLSYLMISRTLDVPMGTVMSRLARARNQLRKLLEGNASPDA